MEREIQGRTSTEVMSIFKQHRWRGPPSRALLPAGKFRACLESHPGGAWTELVSAPRVHPELRAGTGRSAVGREVTALGSGEVRHWLRETNVWVHSLRN